MTEQLEAAAALIAAASLKRVRVLKATMATTLRYADEVQVPQLQLSTQARADIVAEHGQPEFLVLAQLHADIVDVGVEGEDSDGEDQDQDRRAGVVVTLELTYEVPADTELDEVALKAFAETNGIFNAWPYFREFVQSSFVRMDLPPVLLPLYRIHLEETDDLVEQEEGGEEADSVTEDDES